MARPDIAGLLTGISSTQQPVQQAVPGSPNFYGEFMAARGRGLQQGLGGLMRGGEPSTQERIQGAMFELSSPTAGGAAKDTATRIADLTKLARVQQVQGNPAAAAQTAAQVQQLKEQALKAEQSKQLALKVKTINPDLAEQIVNQVPGSMEAGLEALQPKGEIVNIVRGADRKVIGTAIQKPDGSLVDQAGKPVKLTEGFGVSKTIPGAGINLATNPDAQARADRETARIDRQGNMYAETQKLVGPATQNLQVANGIAGLVAKGTPMGKPAEQIASLASTIQSLASVTGLTVPPDINEATADLAKMKKYAGDALMPFVEQQGRGFTDQERKYFLENVIAGMSQPYQFNDTYATVLKSSALSDLEKNNFAFSISNLDTRVKQPEASVWADYENKVPRLTIGQKKYGDQTFEGAIVIEDNENLSRYWATPAGSPKGFLVIDGDNGGTRTMLWPELEGLVAEAKIKGLADRDTMREALAQMSRLGIIVDGVYE